MEDIAAFIEGMPKAELHLHIEGTLEPELKFELAGRNGIDLPYDTVEKVVAAYNFDSLTTFLVGYYEGMGVLQQEQDFYDLAMAYFRKAHSQNLRYTEIFFDPQGHTSRGVQFETVVTGLHRARNDAATDLGLDVQLIMCFLRDMSAESAAETLAQAAPYKDWIVGIGLDSDERGNPPVKFTDVFADAKDQGYHLTMHCDVDQDNTVDHIWQALDVIGVERVDHGVNALEDPALIQALVDRNIGLTVCPVSNIYVVQDSRSTDIKRMLDLGIKATVNSDDPAYFLAYMTENLKTAQSDGNLSKGEIVQLVRNTFDISWATNDKKQSYIADLEEYAAAN
jgi:adenosine deaminase